MAIYIVKCVQQSQNNIHFRTTKKDEVCLKERYFPSFVYSLHHLRVTSDEPPSVKH